MRRLTINGFDDAVVVPSPEGKLFRGARAGVFDSGGRIIERSLLHRTWGQFVFPPEFPDTRSIERDEREVIFGGFLTYHFGHFLLESLSRSWATEELQGLPIVWGNSKAPSAWQKEIFEGLGMTNEQIFIDRPTAFRRVHVPDPGYVIQGRFSDRHRDFLGKFAGSPPVKDRKIWLSRTALGPELKKVRGEERIEEILKDNGWTVFRPEKHSIREQLKTISSSEVVAGVEGSAFHSLCLIRNVGANILMLRRTNNRNYRTIARKKNLQQHDLTGHIENLGARGRDAEYVLTDPERTAACLNGEAQGDPSRDASP